jgi:hypothetical protein
MIARRGNYTVWVEQIIKEGRRRERGEEGKKGEEKEKGREEEGEGGFQAFVRAFDAVGRRVSIARRAIK